MIELLKAKIAEGFAKPSIYPTQGCFTFYEGNGKIHCCGLGAARIATGRDSTDDTITFLHEEFPSLSRDFLCGFVNGFDGYESEKNRSPDFNAGEKVGDEQRRKYKLPKHKE